MDVVKAWGCTGLVAPPQPQDRSTLREDFLEPQFAFQEVRAPRHDSVVLAVALRVKADVLATADRAFEKVTELPIAMPTDLHP
jgi:hypothetical protein